MKCMVLFCENKGKTSGFTYFSLTSKRHDSWMRALGRDPSKEHLSDKNSVCDIHFREEDKFMVKNRLRLRPNAIPQLNLRKSVLRSQANHKSFSAGPSKVDLPRSIENQDGTTLSLVQFDNEENSMENKENIITTVVTGPIEEIPSSLERSPASDITPESLRESSNSDESCTSGVKRKLPVLTSSSDSEGYKGRVKKTRRDVKLIHNYSASPKRVLTQLQNTRKMKNIIQKKLDACRKRVTRLKKKVSSLQEIVQNLRKKNFLSEDALTVLEKSYSGLPLKLMRRAMENMRRRADGKKQGRSKIPEEVRSFAMTLQFYSAKAYAYVRKTFNLALPAPSTIRAWLSNIDCEPGFCQSAFNSLSSIVAENNTQNKKTLCSLMLDEMAIKKQIEVRGSKTWGYENLGADIADESSKYATEALVLMVVSLNSGWKLPIAYFLINSLTGSEKANIVKETLKKLDEIGVIVTSVTCDGPNAHFTMAENLGAKVKKIKNMEPFFKHPLSNSNVYVIFDACHMIKLVRNSWSRHTFFLNSKDEKIGFNYIEKLHTIQEDEFCRLGNKLKKSHLEWRKQKMKVNLAVQTISASVADALEFLKTDIKHPEFEEAGATIEFIRIIDMTFDFLNSRNPFGKGYKTPMKLETEKVWRPLFEKALGYLSSLKLMNGTAIHETKNKTPILGLCTTIKSVLGIYDEYVKKPNSPLNYILTYKFSQDHLELLFCCIRGRNGWNNNPTCFQFYYTFKRLTLHHDIQNINGNCTNLDSTSILTTTQPQKKMYADLTLDDMSVIKKYNIDVNDMVIEDEDFYYVISYLPSLTNLTENVVTYIAGFVVKSLKKIIKCRVCLAVTEDFESNSVDAENFKLLNRKDRGGLIRPAEDIINICFFLERKIRQVLEITSNCMPVEKNFLATFIHQISSILFQDHRLFNNLESHIFDISPYEMNHKLKLIRAIAKIYTKIRFFNIAMAQTATIRGDLKRKTLSRLILFSHQ